MFFNSYFPGLEKGLKIKKISSFYRIKLYIKRAPVERVLLFKKRIAMKFLLIDTLVCVLLVSQVTADDKWNSYKVRKIFSKEILVVSE